MSACIVKKRDGSTEPFQVEKIRRLVEFVSEGLDINPIKLESRINIEQTHEVITTADIVNEIILTSLNLASITEPDWKLVAGRLKMLNLHKQVINNREDGNHKNIEDSYTPMRFYNLIKTMIRTGLYDEEALDSYNTEEILKLGSILNYKNDLDFDYGGINLLIERFLCEKDDKIKELPQEMFMVIAMILEKDTNKQNRIAAVREVYEALATRKISLATPFLMNLRKPNGNLSSCFITIMDDTRDSIFHVIDQIAKISKNGGGVGVNMSRIRATNSRIQGIKNASGGIVPWIKIINDTAIAVNQQGKRKGAVTVSLDVWHLDIMQLLELRLENGDQRMRAMDISPQIVIPDLFMKAVEEDGDWLLVDPNEVRTRYNVELGDLWGDAFNEFYSKLIADANEGKLELFKFIKAKTIMKHVLQSQVETGYPYIAFKDTLNKYNPNKHDGLIVGTNLCTESHSNVSPSIIENEFSGTDDRIISMRKGGLVHVCNLVSVNLANNLDLDSLKNSCYLAVRILDNAIDLTNVPILEGKRHNERYRTIGVGTMGLADWLAHKNIRFDKSANAVNELFEFFALCCIESSINISRSKGVFTAFKGSDWDRGVILGHDSNWYARNAKYKERWANVFKDLKAYGIRNSQITAIAPNTTSAIVQGCTPSILPIYSKFYIEAHGKGSVPTSPPFLKDKFHVYIEGKKIPQSVIIHIASNISRWIDTGVSLELIYNLNDGLSSRTLLDNVIAAWRKDLKTLYYTRTIQQDGSLEEKTECEVCAN